MNRTPVDCDSGNTPVPVFVVGMPRSGTTLMSRLLESSGPYVALPESHFFSRFLWTSIRCRRSATLAASWRRFSRSLGWPLAELDPDPADRSGRVAAPERYRRLFLAWVRAELDAAGVAPGSTGWIENSPPHTEALDVIRELLPDARIVGMLRDPRAVQASLSRVDWNTAHPAANAVRWRLYARALRRRAVADPGHVHLVRYEDLVTDTAGVMGEVGRWLDVPLDPEAFDGEGKASTHGFDPVAEPWKALALGRPDRSRIDGWRQELPLVNRQCVEYWCAVEMRRFGYSVDDGSCLPRRRGSIPAMGMWLRVGALALANRARILGWHTLGGIRRPRETPAG